MKKLCFVIMGYGKKTDPTLGKTFDLDITYNNIIKPAVIKAGYDCVRGDEILEAGIIDKSMYALLIHADLVIADITTFNPNAIYELGIRHAAKPFSTIIMKEKDGNIPFDINHNKIFTYSHMGEDIGFSETERCVTSLSSLISSIGGTEEVDSPLFHHIRGVTPYSLPQEEYTQIIKELADKEKSIFALVEKARIEMQNDNFASASQYWKKVCEKVENDAYFTQQLALCTYKDETIDPHLALTDALQIIGKLEPDNRNTTDPETLGITGAIYKRLWLLDKQEAYLDRAIEYYERGFTINQDYYTGENYALCLGLKSQITKNPEEKIYLKFLAKKVRNEIIQIVKKLEEDEDYNIRSDLKWIFASLANCHLALDNKDEYEKNEALFLAKEPQSWEFKTYNDSKELTLNLIN
ncbi:tetratricopeptide (TPR) repeat protein [Flavobacterium nitrogenifigens]|uniref:Tetratricopeptide (TPR) repeat protein n=2 Tax=Flavobacterium TaxID=237 RepID=A0A7W7J0U6_9FLAO|nr:MULTISPECIES: tetratricopeptide repeat-containing protein [Flavobacterium]MBB4804179.1 tetratricopeptide (TPR) repeat protein [Flavobacterium nitrogenifigens]MBB6389138.1 tetratricopeptide (TPR) repeat protein [Flavobacterium notoginsengisoli]